jgi:hypothetical protein
MIKCRAIRRDGFFDFRVIRITMALARALQIWDSFSRAVVAVAVAGICNTSVILSPIFLIFIIWFHTDQIAKMSLSCDIQRELKADPESEPDLKISTGTNSPVSTFRFTGLFSRLALHFFQLHFK